MLHNTESKHPSNEAHQGQTQTYLVPLRPLLYMLQSQCQILIRCYQCPDPAPATAPDPCPAAATAPASPSVEGKYEGSASSPPAECTAAAPSILIQLTLTHF